MSRLRLLTLAVLVGQTIMGCASAPNRSGGTAGAGDRSADPEFRTAAENVDREFETQAEALAAGIYEPFVHPDSLNPTPGVVAPVDSTVPVDDGADPSTEALLGTLDRDEPYNPGPSSDVMWTLQMGAFGSESGALVRVQSLTRDFPEQPVWLAPGDVFRVFMGRFTDRSSAERLQMRAERLGYGDAFVTHPR